MCMREREEKKEGREEEGERKGENMEISVHVARSGCRGETEVRSHILHSVTSLFTLHVYALLGT